MSQTFIIRYIAGGMLARVALSVCSVLCLLFFLTKGDLVAIIFGVFLSLGLIIIILSFDAVNIDFQKMTYYKYLSVCGIKFGDSPRNLPEIKYLLVKDTILVDKTDGGEGYDPENYYEASFLCNNNLKIILMYSKNKNEIINLVIKTQKKIHCQIKDITKDQLFARLSAN
jgi:hypothetical protein